MTAFLASLIFVVLAAKYQSPFAVWTGTNIGMLVADAIGIIVGIVMHKHIPERAVKWGAALVFIGFGIYGIHENVSEEILTPMIEVISMLGIVLAGWLLARSTQEAVEPEPEG